jgi:hypothetical protein
MIKFRGLTIREWLVIAITAVTIAFISSEASATPPDKYAPPGKVVINKNTIDRSIEQNNRQEQTNFQSQLQQVETGDVNVDSGDVSFSQPRQAHSANAPSVYPSGNCYGGWSAGLGLPGVNVSGGKAVLDRQCDMRETARMFAAVGEREQAVMLLCLTDAGKLLPDCGPTRNFIDDYKALQAQRDMLFEDVTKLADDIKRHCTETSTRVFEICQSGK